MSGSNDLPPSNLAGAARTVALLTLVSRCLGMVRDVVFTFYFGVGALSSAFTIAFMVPNLARRLFGEGALSAAFIPIFTDTLVKDGSTRARRLSGAVLTLLAVVLFGATLLGCGLLLLANAVRGATVLRLSVLMLPYMPLVCLVAIMGGILNVHRRFAAPASAPAILNVVIIITLLAGSVWGHWQGLALLHAVGVGVLVAGVIQIVVQLWALRVARATPILNREWGDPDVSRIMRLMSPMIMGMAAVQINTLADSIIAYIFVDHPGAPAVLFFSQRLYQVPLGVFAISLATAVFPLLAQKAADGDAAGLARVFERGLRMSLFVAIPASVGLCLVGYSLTRGVFEIWGGSFGPDDTVRVARALWFYSLGLPAYAAQHLLVRAFYARKNSREPARIAVVMVLLNLALNLVLVQLMEEAGVALATSLSAGVQVVWLGLALGSTIPEVRWFGSTGMAGPLLRILASAMTMGLVVWFVLQSSPLQSLTGTYAPLVRIAASVTAGVVTYAMAARLINPEGMREVTSRGR